MARWPRRAGRDSDCCQFSIVDFELFDLLRDDLKVGLFE